jgi:hypothetical protein
LVKLRAFATLGIALTVLGQESGNHYDALKQALGLSDAQLSQLQQIKSAPVARPAPTGGSVAIYPAGGFRRMPAQNEVSLRVLDDSQRAKLAAIQRVLDRWDAAEVTIGLGLIEKKQWPGELPCFVSYPIARYGTFDYASELALTSFQIEEFEQIQRDASEPLWAQVRAKVRQRSELLNSGAGEGSPEVVELGSEIDRLQAQTNARPRHDLALAVLDATQKAKLAEFETALQAASEAINLGLIPKHVGEPLCH